MSDTPGSVPSAAQQAAQAMGLVRGAAGGDSAALVRLYDLTGREVLAFTLTLLSTRDVAEEVLLDAYTDAWRQAPSADLVRGGAVDWLKSLARARTIKKLHSADPGVLPAAGESDVPADVTPPEYLRDLLRARIDREPQNPSRETFTVVHSPFAEAAPSRAVRTWIPWVLAAALAVAAALLYNNWRAAEQARAEASGDALSASREAEQLRDNLKSQTARTGELDQIDAALRTPGARTLSVESLPAAPHVALALFWNVQRSECIVTGAIPAHQAGKQYQLWLATPTGRTSVALLDVDSGGRVFQKVPLAPPAIRPATLLITLEPKGGSLQPSTDTYASGRIN